MENISLFLHKLAGYKLAKVVETVDFISGLHNFPQFSHPSCVYINTEKGFCCSHMSILVAIFGI